MRTNRTRINRRAADRGRRASFETLGTRVALSAGGMGTVFFDVSALAHDREPVARHLRTLDAGGEFTTLQQSEWQRAAGALSMRGAAEFAGSDGSGWRPTQFTFGGGAMDRPPLVQGWSPAVSPLGQTQVVPASVQVAGTNLVLPGLLVSHGDALTLVITTSPLYGLPLGSQNSGRSDAREPAGGDHTGLPKPVDVAMPLAMTATDGEQADLPSRAASSFAGANAAEMAPARLNDLPGSTAAAVEPHNGEGHVSGGWLSAETSQSDVEVKPASPQSPHAVGEWAISKAELEEGLIELESPYSPRRKGRKPLTESHEESELPDAWADLQLLAEQVWGAWKQAWQESAQDAGQPAGAEDAAKLARGSADEFDVAVLDGLVELTIEDARAGVHLPRQAEEQWAAERPVRIDAGVAIFQQFEVATAADAAPPATVRTSEQKAAEEEHAEAEKPAEAQPLSAAAVGLGLIMGVPFSLRKRQPEQDEVSPRLRQP